MSELPQVGDIVVIAGNPEKFRVKNIFFWSIADLESLDSWATATAYIDDLTVVERHPGGPGGAR